MPDARNDARDDAPDRLQRGPLAVNEPIDLTGRTALVTGAASGIGASVARALAGAGATVHAVDRDADGLAALADGSGISTIAADLAALDDLANLPTDVDILVNNAGIQHVSPIEEFPLDRFEFILDLMLVSPFRLIRQSLPHMYDRGWGRVVNISSVHGLRASAFKSAYVTRQARPRGSLQGRRARGWPSRRHLHVHQPGLRAHSPGGATDRRPGPHPRHPRVRGRREGHAGTGLRQAPRRARRGRRPDPLPVRPGLRLDQRDVLLDGRWVDGALKPVRLRPPTPHRAA